jgi:hypothetical protein
MDNIMEEGIRMMDARVALGATSTVGTSMAGYLNVIEPIVTIVVTLVVGGLTAWYTWERAVNLRRQRKLKERSKK